VTSQVPAAEDSSEPVNAQFHELYDRVRTNASFSVPVLVVLADAMVLLHRGERAGATLDCPLLPTIKAVAHAPVAAFAALHAAPGESVDGPLKQALVALDERLGVLDTSLTEDPGTARTVQCLRAIVTATRDYLNHVLAIGIGDGATLAAFAKELGPLLLDATSDATHLQLVVLHERVTKMLSALDDADRQRLQVVVAGSHQARARSLPMQYFARLLGEVPGAEVRVTYAEGARDVDEALTLVGTRLLDRAIAEAFFGNPGRLQYDILGDAAKAQLDALDMSARAPSVPPTSRG
jgi:hypothetical protein